MQVTVTLKAASGTAPTFADFPSSVNVRENAAVDTVVATVTATTSGSGGIKYRIVGGNVNSALAINEVKQVIFTACLS